MEYQTIIVERKDHIGLVTLNRPEKLNTFTTELAMELNKALRTLDEEKGVFVIIIKGAGGAFCAGIDLNELSGKSHLEIRRWVGEMDAHNITIAHMKKPVIACVHGAAVANGCGLAAACDLTVASEDARFGTTAINVGLYCFGPSAPVSRCLGKKRSLELLFTGDMIDAKRADVSVATACSVLGVSVIGFYAWRSRRARPQQQRDMILLAHIRAEFAASNETYA